MCGREPFVRQNLGLFVVAIVPRFWSARGSVVLLRGCEISSGSGGFAFSAFSVFVSAVVFFASFVAIALCIVGFVLLGF